MASARPEFMARDLRLMLLFGVASAALLASGHALRAEGRTFVWNGNENLTSFARAGNWDRVWQPGGAPILDGNGNPVYAQGAPVLDDDGNPVLEPYPATDEEGYPLFDEDGNQVFLQIPATDENGDPILDEDGNQVFLPGEQLFHQGEQLFEEDRWIDGPPDGLDRMVVTTGTPTLSSAERHVLDLDMSGGEFVIRNSKFVASMFFVDGTLTLSGSGVINVDDGVFGKSRLTAKTAIVTGGAISGWVNPDTGLLSAGRFVVTETMDQSGGSVADLRVETPSYLMSGGTLSAQVEFASSFALSGTGVVEEAAVLAGAAGSSMTQSGGTMGGTVSGIDSYTQSGGSLGGKVTTGTYALTDAAATSDGGVITASNVFDLVPASGTATVAAKLSGTGDLVKSGNSIVVLANQDNDFSGTVAIDAGTLEVIDGALPDYAAVTVAAGATLAMNTASDTTFMGTVEGDSGELVKKGSATLTLGGDVTLGGLNVEGGTVQVGTGTSENTVSFDYAVVDVGASLYVASGATLTIRIPNNLVNNGTFINDGTVNDDLANTGPFSNNGIYNAKVLSNTNSIDNNANGVWTGDILSNTDRISNNEGATWKGDVVGNAGTIYNHGEWTGEVEGNGNGINNFGGTWTGDVKANSGTIANADGGTWNGDVLGNKGIIFNMAGAEWNGDIVGNGGNDVFAPIINRGLWTGDVKGSSSFVFNDGGTWKGDVLAITGGVTSTGSWTGDIVTNESQIHNQEGGTWTGDVLGNNNAIFNEVDSNWVGDVLGNGGGSNGMAQVINRGLWTGDVKGNAGILLNEGGTWKGNVLANAARVSNTGSWIGDIEGSDSQISNEGGGTWDGDILGNNNVIFNEVDSTWTGHVVANSGGSNVHTQIVNRGDWIGDVQTNARAIYNEDGGIWTGDVLANAGAIVTTGIWNGDFTSAGRVIAEGQINGAFDNSGTLRVTGALTGLTTLSNTGTVSLKGGGTTQRLTAASASFGNGSFFDIDVDATGASDRMTTTGTATFDGTVRVTAGTTNGPYDESKVYTILSAGTLAGAFDAVSTDLVFLTPKLSYDNNAVQLMLNRNDISFAEVGVTANQKAAAGGAYALNAGNPIFDALLWLTRDQAPAAFDALSGEAYGSFGSVSVQDAVVIADLVTGRVDRAFYTDGGEARSIIVTSYDESPEPAAGPGRNTGIWGQLYGAYGRLERAAAISGVESAMGGVAGGFDGLLGDWRLGAMLHAGRSSADVDDLGTSSDSTDYGAGVYGGRQWGATRLAFGAAYARHDVDASRSVVFPGVDEDLAGSYAAGTAQAFGKLSHVFSVGAASLIPYASLAYVSHDTDAFSETGGDAALDVASDRLDATFATLGLGGDRSFLVGDRLLTAKAALGWRHAFSDAPISSRAFAGGGSFDIVGASIASDMIVINAGLNFAVGAASTLDVTYDGQIGDDAETHAVRGGWATRF